MAESQISSSVAGITPSVTLAVATKAKALKAAGEPVIGFGAGEPDFPTPDYIVEAAVKACREPKNHKYSPVPGWPELREAIAYKTKRDSGFVAEASQVVVTNGGKQAVFNSLQTLINPGDEVMILAPYWTTYPEPVKLAGGVVVEVITPISQGFKATVDQLEAARTPQTKVLIFVSPSNPTGAVYSKAEIEQIGAWAVENNVWVITDEIYEHLVYDDNEFHSLPTVAPEIADRCVVLNGVAKSYAMTGWRVGWMIAPTEVAKAASSLQSHQTSNVCNVAQAATLAAVSGDLEASMRMREAFDRRRKKMFEMLSETNGVDVLLPEGAFYAFPSFEKIIGQNVAGTKISSSAQLAEVVLEHAKIAFVPGEAFGAPGYGRFSFALGDEDLEEGLTRFQDLLATIV